MNKLVLSLLLGLSSFGTAQEPTYLIPTLREEMNTPRLHTSEVTGEGAAEDRAGNPVTYRDYTSQMLIDAGTGELFNVDWSFYQRESGVVSEVAVETIGVAGSPAFDYANGFLIALLSNLCFGLAEHDHQNLGEWYARTLAKATEAGQGRYANSFGGVHVAFALSAHTDGRQRMEQEVWRGDAQGGAWEAHCALE